MTDAAEMGIAEQLLVDWTGLAGSSPEAEMFGQELIVNYQHPSRRYHTTEHLWHVLRMVDLLIEEAADPAAVRYAAWFHDAIYEIDGDSRLSNEEQSARLAEDILEALGVPAALGDEVGRLVRLTAHHRIEPEDANGGVLSDADLAILAADPADYERYRAQIRDEYREIPDELFRPGRAAILQALLDHPAIYRTPAGRELFETAARRNIAAEIEQLLGSRN
jgi:predicted metal-dependent HD superfamily phosphohydrolase